MMGWNHLSITYKPLRLWLRACFLQNNQASSIPLITVDDADETSRMPIKKDKNTERQDILSVWPQSTQLLFLRAEVGGQQLV